MAIAGLEALTGTKIYVSAAIPATEDEAGYEALTWAEVVGVVSFGEWGDTEENISEPLLGEDRVTHLNGVADGGEVQISVQHRTTDAGSDIIKTNSGGNTIVSVKKLYPSGDAEYSYGVFSSPRFREASSGSVRGYTSMMRMNAPVLEVPAD